MAIKDLWAPKKKRGRPKKKIETGESHPEKEEHKGKIASFINRDIFALGRFGIKEDPTKDRRWVDPKRIEERKHNDGYELYKGKGNSTDGTTRTKGNMVLMERNRELAEASKVNKAIRTNRQTSSSKEAFSEAVEVLSKKYDVDLHKLIK